MNENLATVSRLIPRSIPVKIVEPDRESPGKIAMACAHPINNARGQFS